MNKRLLILGLLVLAVWVAATLWPEPGDKPSDADGIWPPLQTSGVTGIQQQAEEASFSLHKQEQSGAWLVRSKNVPDLRADMVKVDSLLNYIKGHKPIRRLQEHISAPNENSPELDAKQLAQFGLDKPQTVLTLEADKDWSIALGAANPSGDGVYALSSQEPGILLLDAGYTEQFSRSPDHYYDLRLLDMTAETVQKIRAEGAVEWELARTQGDGWAFTWPEALEDQPVAVHEAAMYAHELASLEGSAYLTDFSTPPPQDMVEIKFTVWRTGADAPETMRLMHIPPVVDNASLEQEGGPEPARYLATSSWQKAPVLLDAKAWSKLHKTAFYLHDRSILSVNQGELGRIELVPSDTTRYKPLQAEKGETLWLDGQGEKLVGMDVLLWRLNDMKYQGPSRDSLPDSARELLVWNLWNKDGELVAAVQFSRDPELPPGQCWVGLDASETYYPVDEELADDLLTRLSAAQSQDASASGATAQE